MLLVADNIATVFDELKTRLLNNLPTGHTTKTIEIPNGKFDTPKNSKWLRITFIDGVKSNVQAGGGYKRTFGNFVIDSFYPLGKGTKTQLDEIKVLQNLYENEEIGSAKCQEADINIIGEDGAWFHIQINVNMYYEGV